MDSVTEEFEKWWIKLNKAIDTKDRMFNQEMLKKMLMLAFIAGETSGLSRAFEEIRGK